MDASIPRRRTHGISGSRGASLCWIVVILPACYRGEFLAGLADRAEEVVLHLTHHASPIDGFYPNADAEDGEARLFTNDLGWEITLTSAQVVISGAELVTCNGHEVPIQSYFPPDIVSFTSPDLEVTTMGGAKVASSLCSLRLRHAPVDGVPAVILQGVAHDGSDSVPFQVSSHDLLGQRVFEFDDALGGEVALDSDEFPTQLTVSWTYDRLFDGVDFFTLDSEALDSVIVDVVGGQAQVSLGAGPT